MSNSQFTNSRTHFRGYNGARMLAAFAVVIHHIEQIKYLFRLPSGWGIDPWVFSIGKQGVDFFFVLSGFLITYLLLEEKKSHGEFSVRNFYIRRILRILPLYFLITLTTFFVLPLLDSGSANAGLEFVHYAVHLTQGSFYQKFALFFFLMPNAAAALYPPVWFAAQCWSVGLEEQFYLIWPWALRLVRCRVFLLSTLVIAAKLAVIAFVNDTGNTHAGLEMFRVECLAIGAAAANLQFRYPLMVRKFSRYILLQVAIIPFLILLFCIGQQIPIFGIVPAFYALILLILKESKIPLLNLENPVFSYLGKISYGIYMYQIHGIIITFGIGSALGIFEAPPGLVNLYLFTVAPALTVLIAGLSYHFMERPIISLKRRLESPLPARLEPAANFSLHGT